MKKFVLMLGAAAIAIYGTYSLVSALQKPDAVVSGPAPTGGIVIVPASVFANTTLEARLEGQNGHAADPGACRWFVNDAEVADATTATLAPGHFKKGDSVRAETNANGTKLVSKTVVIANSPPRITHASADLRQEPSAEIYLRVASADADNDPVTYTYEWFKNGEPVAGESGASIDVSQFQKGDNVYANVTASDGDDASSPQKSDPVKLGSNAPKITSTPPQALEDDRRFVYQVTVAPSAGSVHYELTQAPMGMSISAGGRIEWTVPLEESADGATTHKAVVRVTDSLGGYSTQEFSITTSVQASSAGE